MKTFNWDHVYKKLIDERNMDELKDIRIMIFKFDD